MTFHPDKAQEFIEVFSNAKPLIESFNGCSRVELMRDTEQSNVFFTFSIWHTTEALDVYRSSDLFHTTWEKAKQLFSGRPEAWSIEKLL